MNKLCDEPNPLGDEILFYSSDGTESYKKLSQASRENAKKSGISTDKVLIEGNSEIGSEGSSEESSVIGSDNGSDNTSTPDTPQAKGGAGDSEGEAKVVGEEEVLTVRQHQKFFQAYEEEAENLANDYADRLRMSHNIGET
jgi:hypothetical protein